QPTKMSGPVDPSRVYVGNVNFNATEEELQEFFQDFKVLSVEIPSKTITRGENSFEKRLGFGFVQFENENDAVNAISQMNGKKFKQRQIHATKALPPATEEEKQKKKDLALAKQAELKAKKREAAKQANQAKQAKEAQQAKEAKEKTGSTATTKKPSPGKSTENVSKTPTGKISTDTIFITNLDYKTNGKGLSDLFKDLKPIWVNVPTRRVPFHMLKRFNALKKPIFNKGIGFAKFADEETQLRAIQEFNGTEINGRKIIVEAAVD
ncbi:RNA-binding domain-containing protein, partial [Metschnikowia bicuspidata var. bicuspidata NRRL YB-4993]